MPLYDFHCRTCERTFEEFSEYNRSTGRVDPVEHGVCGTLSEVRWIQAPGLVSDEKIPKELDDPRQTGKKFESRTELNRWMKENNVEAVSRGEWESRSAAAYDARAEKPKAQLPENIEEKVREKFRENVSKARSGELPPLEIHEPGKVQTLAPQNESIDFEVDTTHNPTLEGAR